MSTIKELANELIDLLSNCEDEDLVDEVIQRVSECCPFLEDEDEEDY